MKISEMFYSFQGEGPERGNPAIFIRLGGCNLTCGIQSKICDASKATWFCDSYKIWNKSDDLTIDQVGSAIDKMVKDKHIPQGAHIVFTGGEPCLPSNAKDIKALIKTFDLDEDFVLEIETNGTILDTELLGYIDVVNCSPKLSNSGIDKKIRINEGLLSYLKYRSNAWVKFVVTSQDQWLEIENDFLPLISKSQIILMPGMEKLSPEATKVCQEVWNLALEQGVKYSTREQITVWDARTGV